MRKLFFNITVSFYFALNLYMFFSLEPNMLNYDIFRAIFGMHIIVFFQVLWAKLVLYLTYSRKSCNE